MGWLLSILVGLLTAVAGCFGAGALAAVCVDWYRISSREGASGYFIVFMGLFGAAAGLVLGVVCARIVAGRPDPTFLKGLGVAIGAAAAILLVIAGLAYLGADFPPRLDGKELSVEVEVRLPEGATVPTAEEARGHWYVTITADGGKRRQSLAELRPGEARQVEGRWVVPGSVRLETDDPGKSLGVDLGEKLALYYRLPLPGHPSRKDFEWSGWLTDGTRGGLSEPGPQDGQVAVRYRVQTYVPPPPPLPGPTQEEIEAKQKAEDEAAFRALTPDSPIDAWLAFTRYGKPDEVREAAAEAIAARKDAVAELSALVRGSDREAAAVALRAISQMKAPPAGLFPAVDDVAKALADEIRVVNATTVEQDPHYQKAGDLSVLFTAWSLAAWKMHGRNGADFLPRMRELLELASVRTESHAMQQDVARVCRYYVTEWSAPSPAR